MRTVRYYHKIGLLNPVGRSASGQRLYTEMDFVRLGQILTLKLIGLSLDEIKHLLTTDMGELQDLMARQKVVLNQQMRQLAAVIQTIERAENALRASQSPDLDQFIQIIKAVNMNSHSDWFSQFVTDEQLGRLNERGQGLALPDQKQAGEAWRNLFHDIQAHLDTDVNDPIVQQLINRWDTLMGDVTGGDPDIAAALIQAYAHIDTLPEMSRLPDEIYEWTRGLGLAASFIQKARTAKG